MTTLGIVINSLNCYWIYNQCSLWVSASVIWVTSKGLCGKHVHQYYNMWSNSS